MKVSVIIPTYNGSKKITNILSSLSKQTYQDFEVIVIIDGSTDNTLSILNSNEFNLPKIKIISQENKGRGSARNTGANIAENELLIFFDDDILPEENCIELHVSNHLKYQDSTIIGTCRMDIKHFPATDFINYRYSVEDKWQTPYKNRITKISFNRYSFTTANMSIPKGLFTKIGGFDNRLNDSEDFDFSIKLLLNNTYIFFDYSIWAWHCDYTNIIGYIKRQKEYFDSKDKLAELKPEYVKLIPSHFSRKEVSQIKFIFSRLFRYNFFWHSVLKGTIFLYLIPKKIRYMLYDKIIFSSSIR